MKKILLLILCFVIISLTGCMGNPSEITVPPEVENEENEEKLPSVFSFDNLLISLEEIIETIQVDFNDGGTKVTLTNNDGKYFLANYKIKNNESYEIDIDHSVEVTVTDISGNIHYGEYYEYQTGKENITVKSGEEKMVSFICDIGAEEKADFITFKYKDKVFIKKAEVE